MGGWHGAVLGTRWGPPNGVRICETKPQGQQAAPARTLGRREGSSRPRQALGPQLSSLPRVTTPAANLPSTVNARAVGSLREQCPHQTNQSEPLGAPIFTQGHTARALA